MTKNYSFIFIIFLNFCYSQVQTGNFSVNPSSFYEDESVTITVSGIDPSIWGVSDVYLWAWYYKNGVQQGDSPNNGTWDNSSEAQKLNANDDGTFSISFVPNDFFDDTEISRMGILVKAKDGTGDKKTQDYLHYVGKVQLTILNPSFNPVTVENGGSISISAEMMSSGSTQAGDFEIYYNENLISSGQGYPRLNQTISNISENGTLKVRGKPFGQSDFGESSMQVYVNPEIEFSAMNANLQDGVNHSNTGNEVTLVLNAPGKEYVYVAGSFNDYTQNQNYLMKKDPNSGKFWLKIEGLNNQDLYTYQYWVYDSNPISESPYLVKTADPFSTLVLSPYDDDYISEITYPNLPQYPHGQEREVSVMRAEKPTYNWQVTNFQKPKKEDLIIYEVLVRDFDENRNFQDLINRVDYFNNLNINAIQLMPVMEFEGNESWGYNTAFHLALDKFYGTPSKFKELVDTFHQNGIAVILDLAINHAFGRAPGIRMWMNDEDANGWGDPSTENPYFNTEPKHSYSVGSDYNHQSELTQYFTKRVIKHWIEEYKIDGIRWDLTKGFTQNCGPNNDGCTNDYQADRVAILKEYADYSWSLDPDHYVIFEHLGGDNEEKEWANYRLNEDKGIMIWGKMTTPFNQLSMGFGTDASIERMRSESRGFNGKRLVGYAESHDEERLMYRNLQYGNSTNANHNIKNLNTALSRMSAIGAVSLLIPGPKMIWHFGELGMQQSINTCPDGSVGNCKLDTKPQLQWDENWLNIAQRKQIYDDWSSINSLKRSYSVFKANSALSPYNNNNLLQRIYVWDDNLSENQLKNVVILANFDVNTQTIGSGFPYTGTWYNLMDNTTFEVSNTNQGISLQAGEFKIFGNQQASLTRSELNIFQELKLIQNPVQDHIKFQTPTSLFGNIDWKIYNTLGIEVAYGSTLIQNQTLQISAPKKQGSYFIVLRHTNTDAIRMIKILRQ